MLNTHQHRVVTKEVFWAKSRTNNYNFLQHGVD